MHGFKIFCSQSVKPALQHQVLHCDSELRSTSESKSSLVSAVSLSSKFSSTLSKALDMPAFTNPFTYNELWVSRYICGHFYEPLCTQFF